VNDSAIDAYPRNGGCLSLKGTREKPLASIGKSSPSDKGQDIWLLTLSDLLLLLLIFFVLLFGLTLQEIKPDSPSATAQTAAKEEPVPTRPASIPDSPAKDALGAVESELSALLKEREGDMEIEREADRLLLTFPERIMFDSGRADLKASVPSILQHVASAASVHSRLRVEVQGHTDDKPINTRRHPSNWELSVDRATQVARALIQLGLNPAQISVRGFGEYRSRYPNDSDANRERNRRVEIQFSFGPQLKTNDIQ
jgi:chemotaxis protein MotB